MNVGCRSRVSISQKIAEHIVSIIDFSIPFIIQFWSATLNDLDLFQFEDIRNIFLYSGDLSRLCGSIFDLCRGP